MHELSLHLKNSHRNKVKPEEVGHPIFMILAYPMVNKKTGKRARKVLYFHHMSSPTQEAVEFQVRVIFSLIHSVLRWVLNKLIRKKPSPFMAKNHSNE